MRKLLLCLTLILGSLSSLFSNQGTVVGIHGLMSTNESLFAVRNTLKKVCFDVCLWEYDSREKTVECHADCLVETLKAIACACPGRPIHFVTHSIGGWVLRSALSHPECPREAKIGRAVLLAPPNQGSLLARKFRHSFLIQFILKNQCGYQILNFEPWDVQQLGCYPSTMQVLVIAGCRGIHPWFTGPNDGWLEVKETYLETPCAFKIFPLTHGKLLQNDCCLQAVRDFLICGSVD